MFQRLRHGHIFLGASFQPTTHDKCKKKKKPTCSHIKMKMQKNKLKKREQPQNKDNFSSMD